MKTLFTITLAVSAFLAVPIAYGTAKGYIAWFWLKPFSEVLVNGKPVKSTIHKSSRVMIITLRDTSPPHSYLLALEKPGKQPVVKCRDYVASRSPVILANHQKLICTVLDFGEPLATPDPDAPSGRAEVDADHIEFKTYKGSTVRIDR